MVGGRVQAVQNSWRRKWYECSLLTFNSVIVRLKRDSCNNTGSSEILMPSEVRLTEQRHCNGDDSLLLGYGAALVGNLYMDVSKERGAFEASLSY